MRGKKLRIVRVPHQTSVVPTVFFFHGAGGQAAQWIEQMQYFYNRLSMVAVDMVGHGKSEVTDRFEDYSPESLSQDLLEVFNRCVSLSFPLPSSPYPSLPLRLCLNRSISIIG